MRILLVHNYYQYWGGEDTYFESLKKLLLKSGHEVTVYTKDNREIKSLWQKIKTGLGMFWSFETESELSETIAKYKPDIVHLNNLYPLISPTAYWVGKKHNIPIVQHIHNYRFICPKGMLFRAGKICELCVRKKLPFYAALFGCYHESRLASLIFAFSYFFHRMIRTFDLIDVFVFPSEFTKAYYQKHLWIPEKKTAVIPYFVEEPKKQKKRKKKKNYFLFVGRLSEEKGIIPLLEVFKNLPEIPLVIIGDGPLRKKICRYKGFKNIKVAGFFSKEKTYGYIRNAICIIVPSQWYETGPIVVEEALANGALILGPETPVFRERMIKNKTGVFFKLGDFQDLRKKALLIWKRREAGRTQYGKIAEGVFRKNYSEKAHYQKLHKTYRKVV